MGTVRVAAEKRVEASARGATAKRLLTMYARLAIAAGFLSSVADRFGLWGPAGSAKVAWGNWKNFVAYTAGLNFFFPRRSAPNLALVEAISRYRLGIFFIVGGGHRATQAGRAGLRGRFCFGRSVVRPVNDPPGSL